MSGHYTENGYYVYDFEPTYGRGGSHARVTARELETGRGSVIVDMFGSHLEEVPSGEGKRLFTSGLSGCTAIGIIAQDASGKRTTFLQHADPFQMTFRDRGGVSLPGVDAVSGKAIIMAQGYGSPVALSEAGDRPPHLEQADAVYDIAHQLGQMVGTENVHIVPYSAIERTDSNPYANSLVVDVSQDGLGTFLADGWYSA